MSPFLSSVVFFHRSSKKPRRADQERHSPISTGRSFITAPCRQPWPAGTRATSLHQNDIVPLAFEVPETLAITDLAKSATPMQRPA